MRVLSVAAAILAMAGSAQAASSVVQYGPAPTWISPPPVQAGDKPPEGAAVQVLYVDTQTRLGSDGDEFYRAYRLKILKPEALALGNISAMWSPSADDIRIHRLKIIRDGREIDVLAGSKFKVLQREDNLEASVLSGDLTATLQTPGLQVGDELEFAATVKRRDPTLGDRSQGDMQLPTIGALGSYRLRLVWPKARDVHWRTSPDFDQVKPVEVAGDYALSYELRDPKTAIIADGAPPRVNVRRLLQFSSFANWADVSNTLAPIFEKASVLAPNSPVKAEAAKIAAASNDPAKRTEAALRLVQERIRYVYVGLDGANYSPAAPDETWDRRFGDCKAKTVLLLALLRELGLPSEAALVNSQGGDGIDELLPMPGVFNHVLVRTELAGRTYWLDGTRFGDKSLDLLPPPAFRWALPVRRGAVTLERVNPVAPMLVEGGEVLEVDARQGFDTPAKVSAEEIFRGDAALLFKTQLAQMSKDDAERAMRAYWTKNYNWVEPGAVAWRYDESQNLAVLTMTGEGKPEWEGDDQDGRSLDVYGAGFSPPPPFRRPKEQDQTAPWMTDFPLYKRWTTIIRLPHSDTKAWSYRASQMNVRMGGVSYWRDAELNDEVLRTTMSKRVLTPEITADEAAAVNKQLPTFDNKISQVFQYKRDAADDAEPDFESQAGKDPEKLAGLGEYLFQKGKKDRALRVVDKALAIDPKSIPALAVKLEILAAQDPAKARAFADNAVKTNPDPRLALARAKILVQAGATQEGFAAMDAVFTAHPDEAGLLADYVNQARQLGHLDHALEAASAAVKLDPSNVVQRRLRSGVYFDLGRYADALPDMDEAIRLQPDDSLNLRNRASALSKLGRTDAAIADLDEVWRMNPLDPSVDFVKARILLKAGRGPEAVALYDAAVDRKRDAGALNNRCWMRALANVELPGAEADCAEAVKLEPKAAAYWDSYAVVALRAGRLDDAMTRFAQALTLSPKLAASLYGRGLTKLRKGDVIGGNQDIAAARALSPKVGDELEAAGIAPREIARAS